MNNMSCKRKAPASPLTPSKRAHRVLTLAEKVQVIDAVDDGNLTGCGTFF